MGRVNVEISGDSSGFSQAVKGVSHSLEGLKSMVAGAFSVGVITSMIEKTFDYADTIDKASLRMKLTTEQTQGLSIVAKEAGSSLETVEEAFKKIEEARKKALNGDKDALANFTTLGINAKSLADEHNKIELASRIASAAGKGSTDKEGVALQNLGLRGASGDLIALGDSLIEFDKTVAKLKSKGAIMADSDIANMVHAKDELAVTGDILMAKIAPWISQVIDGIQEGWIIINAGAKAFFLFCIDMFDVVKGKISDIIEYVKHPIKGTINVVKSEVKAVVKVVNDATDGYIKDGYTGAAKAVGNDVKKSVVDSDTYKNAVTAGNSFLTDMDKGLNDLASEKAEMMNKRKAAREEKPEAPDKIIPTVKEKVESKKIYSDSLTSVGNMLGASYQGISHVTTQIDLQKQANSKFDKMLDKITLSNTYLESLTKNKPTAGVGFNTSIF